MRKISKLTVLLFVAFFTYGFTVFAIGPCLTSIQETFHVSRQVLGIIFPIFSIFFVIASLVSGLLSDRFGKKTLLILGLFTYGISLMFFALVPHLSATPIFMLAVIAMAFNGAAGGLIELNLSVLVADVNPHHKATVLNALQVAFGMGAVTGPLAVAALFSHSLSWQVLYFGGGILGVLMGVFLMLEKTPRTHSREVPVTKTARIALMKSSAVWALFLAMLFYVGAEVSFADWQSDFLEKGLSAPRVVASAVPSFFWLAMTIGRSISSAMVKRWVARKSIMVMGFAGSLAILLVMSVKSVPFAIAGIFMAGLFLAGSFGMILTYATERFGDYMSPVFSVMIAGVGLGSGFFPALVGIAADHSSIQQAMLLPAFLAFSLGILFTGIHRLPDPSWQAYQSSQQEETHLKN